MERERRPRVVVICGGNFQGKSLVSLRVASRLGLTAAISTDSIGLLLRSLFPGDSELSTSSYRLSKRDFEAQVRRISGLAMDLTTGYVARGESIVVEGIHLSRPFLEWAREKNYCCVVLDNELNLEKRVILKHGTRSLLRLRDSNSAGGYRYGRIDRENVGLSAYVENSERIREIQAEIVRMGRENGFKIVRFATLRKAVEEVLLAVNGCYGRNGDCR